jgi:hypothetical protein
VQVKALAQSGGSQSVLTLGMWNNWQINFLQNDLVFSFLTEEIFSPTTK